MPRNLNAWLDICFILFAALILTGILTYYNLFIGLGAGLVWLCLLFFGRERCLCRSEEFEHYCHTVISNVNSAANYALEKLPQVIILVDKEGRIQWFNKELEKHINIEPTYNIAMADFWPELDLEPLWGRNGKTVFVHENIHYQVIHRPVSTKENPCGMLALYIQDNSALEILKNIHADSRTTLMYIQIDNFNDVLQGLNDTEQNSLIFETNKAITDWMNHLEGFLRKVSEDLYIAVMEKRNLDTAMEEKFDVLDKVRNLQNPVRHLSVTLSIGVAVADRQNLNQLGGKAYSMLEMALSRGGDQVAVLKRGKTEFYGGKTNAVEKYTRVKARIISNSIYELIQESDEVFIMGHQNEDFDSLGAAIGVSRMAKYLKKPVHIILSEFNTGISKFTETLKTKEGYSELFLPANKLINITAERPVLFVVVTELLIYFSDDLTLPRMEATALYAGILVDTKNFAVQTGVRTFDAAAYLRRCGADPVSVRQMFRSDFETEQAKAQAKAQARMLPGGLIITMCREPLPNIQVIAAQVADSMLRIEDVRVSMVVFQLTPDVIGISARSTGTINVQVIMEQFGGGGHQNVAGAQIVNSDIDTVFEDVITATQLFIEENDKNESNTATGR